MEIRRLKLSGFKSFVEPAELRIEPGLTGVVGPNGCGKSNVLEAIRWVMGETSARSMRSGGMEDVIFAGTDARPPRQFAEVILYAADDAGEELEVVRRIERGAGSAYRVNGRDVRAKDVALTFADAATGAHSPALVSQGKIAQVIAAKPAERRAMLEEAAGIAGLHVRRKDAESKLRSTEKNLARLDDLIAGLDSQMASLRRQAKQAERYKALTDQIGVAEARLLFARWRDAAASAEAARAAAKEAEAAVEQARERSLAADAEQHETAEALATARDALVEARAAGAAHQHRLDALEKEHAGLLASLADLDRQAERLETDREDYGRVGRDAADALTQLKADLAASEAAMEDAKAALPELVEDVQRAETAERSAELALAKANADHAALDAEWRVAVAAREEAERRMARVEQEAERLAQDAAKLTGGEDYAAALQSALDEVEAATGARQAADAMIAEAREARDAARVARDAAQETLANARADLAGIEREHAALTRDRDAREKRRSATSSLPAALDKVRAAPGYELALAAVLGRDAASLLGSPGSDEDGRYWTGAETAPAVQRSLLDHVSDCPPQLRARLARVHVDESDDGRSLAPGEWLVTLSGHLRRWDGLVVRGEGSTEAAELANANRLAELSSQLPGLRAAVERAEAALGEANAHASSASERLGQAEAKGQEAVEAERTALRNRDRAEAAAEQAAQSAQRLIEAREALAEQRTTVERDLATAREAEAALPARDTLGERRQAAQDAHEAARERLRGVTATRAAQEQALAVAKERVAAHRADRAHWDRRADEAARRLAEMDERAQEIADKREDIGDWPQALEAKIAEARSAHADSAEHLATLEVSLERARAVSDTAENARREAQEALSSARERRAQLENQAENEDARRVEMTRISGERFQQPPPLLPQTFEFDEETIGPRDVESAALEKLNTSRERIGPVNLVAAEELAKLEDEHGDMAREQAELTEAVHRLRGSIGSLNREGRERLRAAFTAVDGHFQRLFTRLFEGGQAHLALVDSDDPLEAGLEIFAQPPGKRLQSLTLLSGGEQALTAIALTFALFLTNPAPICVLDEVDAPLDDANIDRFCDLLDAMTRETATRYLIVTHNAVTMSRMHRLFGVTMVEKGVSRLVSVDLQAAELLAAE